jgi:hypothetical protein
VTELVALVVHPVLERVRRSIAAVRVQMAVGLTAAAAAVQPGLRLLAAMVPARRVGRETVPAEMAALVVLGRQTAATVRPPAAVVVVWAMAGLRLVAGLPVA